MRARGGPPCVGLTSDDRKAGRCRARFIYLAAGAGPRDYGRPARRPRADEKTLLAPRRAGAKSLSRTRGPDARGTRRIPRAMFPRALTNLRSRPRRFALDRAISLLLFISPLKSPHDRRLLLLLSAISIVKPRPSLKRESQRNSGTFST